MKRTITLALVTIAGFAAFAQQQQQKQQPLSGSTGLVFDDDEYNKTPMQSKFAGSKFSELPLKVSLRKYCPKPGNQGKIGSCVGWSTCYGALTTQYAIRNNITDKKKITQQAFSALFLYNLVKQNDPDCDGGTRIPIAMSMLQQTGSCFDKEFIRNKCSVLPHDTLKAKAKQYAIEDYMSLFATFDDAKMKIQKTKQSLAENKPVVVGLSLLDNFNYISKSDPVWHTDKGYGWPSGGHAVCVVGYDEGKEEFEILNSWGEEWGDSGYFYVKYSDYGKYCKYGFQMYLRPDKVSPSDKEMGGNFVFQYLKDKATLKFEQVVPKHLALGYYTLDKHDWKVGDLFQLVAKNSKADEYVYVFSVDAKSEAHIHFPRSSSLSSEYEGFNETPLVPISNAEIIIPTPESALSIANPGTDYLVVLFSKKKIDNIGEIISTAKKASKGLLPFELRRAIGSRLVRSSEVKYDPNKMSFTSSAAPDAVVPMILSVDSSQQ